MPADDAGRRREPAFASKGRAGAYAALSILTSAMFPLFLWVSVSDVVVPDATLVSVGITAVAIGTAFKHFPHNGTETELSFRDVFCAATTRLGLGERAGAILFWILLIVALGSFFVLPFWVAAAA